MYVKEMKKVYQGGQAVCWKLKLTYKLILIGVKESRRQRLGYKSAKSE